MFSCLSWPAAVWLFIASTALHNLEEAIWLPGFTGFAPLASVPPRAFRFAAAALTLLFGAAGALAIGGGAHSLGAYLICGLALAMSVNAVAPHLALSLARRSYMPGSATALALVLPSGVFLMGKSLGEDYLSPRVFAAAGPATALLLLLVTIGLLRVGVLLERAGA